MHQLSCTWWGRGDAVRQHVDSSIQQHTWQCYQVSHHVQRTVQVNLLHPKPAASQVKVGSAKNSTGKAQYHYDAA